jgi:hypothetical protein
MFNITGFEKELFPYSYYNSHRILGPEASNAGVISEVARSQKSTPDQQE